jgi:hypothetical protein
LFKKRKELSATNRKTKRLTSMVSTLSGKHGHAKDHTEVPRQTLVEALDRFSDFHTTQPKDSEDHTEHGFAKGQLFKDVFV